MDKNLTLWASCPKLSTLQRKKWADREAKLLQGTETVREQNRALQQGQLLLMTLTQQMTDWFVIKNPNENNIKYANHSCQQFLDVRPETEPFLTNMLNNCPALGTRKYGCSGKRSFRQRYRGQVTCHI